MAWIESHQTLLNHPKLASVCQTLDAERATIIGHLHIMWWWCVDYALDGELHYTNAQIAAGAGWTKNADEFVNALVDAGFLDRDESGLRVHDWLDFCGTLISKRLEREEKRNLGAKTSAKRRIVESKRAATDSKRAKKSTNPTLPNPTLPNPTIPDALARVPGFIDAWGRWEVARKEMHKPLTYSARKEQLKMLEQQPDPVAVLNQSIRNQWRGLFELKENGNGKGNRAGNREGGRQRHTYTEADVRASILPSGRT